MSKYTKDKQSKKDLESLDKYIFNLAKKSEKPPSNLHIKIQKIIENVFFNNK